MSNQINSLINDFMNRGKDKIFSNKIIMSNQLLDRYKGCLIGVAIGDAFGRAVESRNPPKEPFITKYENWKGPKGSITDDTQMTIWLAKSLIKNKGMNPKDIAERFCSGKIIGIGDATKEFVSNFKNKKQAWYDAGTESAGNGAVMRTAPIGLVYANNFLKLKEASILQTIITHKHCIAVASSLVVSYAISTLLRMKPEDLNTLESKISFCHNISEVIEDFGDSAKLRNSEKIDSIYDRIHNQIPEMLKKNYSPEQADKRFYSGAFALETLPFALYCFLLSPDDFYKTIYNSANYSRDSDSVASIAAGLSGALNGMKTISEVTVEVEGKRRNFIDKLNYPDKYPKKEFSQKLEYISTKLLELCCEIEVDNNSESWGSNPYKVLDLQPGATPDQIKKAYKDLSQKYHPDKVNHLGEEFKILAHKKFKEISEAYQELISSYNI